MICEIWWVCSFSWAFVSILLVSLTAVVICGAVRKRVLRISSSFKWWATSLSLALWFFLILLHFFDDTIPIFRFFLLFIFILVIIIITLYVFLLLCLINNMARHRREQMLFVLALLPLHLFVYIAISFFFRYCSYLCLPDNIACFVKFLIDLFELITVFSMSTFTWV